jgi:hypothetical protein
VDDLRHELMDWVLDYLAEPMSHSIHRIQGRWSMNWRWRGGDRRGKESLAQPIRGCYRGKTTSDDLAI